MDPKTLINTNRRKAAAELLKNATPPIVPLANPPTSMLEVPPGTAPIRANPAPTIENSDSQEAKKDSVGEVAAPFPEQAKT